MDSVKLSKFVDGLNRSEISTLYSLLKQRTKEMDVDALCSGTLRRGTKVSFKPSQRRFGGATLSGVVEGQRGRKLVVNVGGGSMWRVPPAMLTVVK